MLFKKGIKICLVLKPAHFGNIADKIFVSVVKQQMLCLIQSAALNKIVYRRSRKMLKISVKL